MKVHWCGVSARRFLPLLFLASFCSLAHARSPADRGAVPQTIKVDGSVFELTFDDEFNGNSLDPKVWEVEGAAYPSNLLLSGRWPENILVSGGILSLLTKHEARGGKNWSTGHIATKFFRQKYGRFEARFQIADATGLNNAFWLMNTAPYVDLKTGKPVPGEEVEIDIAEAHLPNKVHMSNYVWEGKGHRLDTHLKHSSADLSADFHTYTFEWDEHTLTWLVDGQVMHTKKNYSCHEPLQVRFSTAIMGYNWAGAVRPSGDKKSMNIDWIRVYQKR